MNCKPGDLAVIVSDPEFQHRDIGKIVRCIRLVVDYELDEPEFECESLSGPLAIWVDFANAPSEGATEVDIPDAWLRPIRDPGDDARDETLNWLPVPHKETA